MLCLHSSLLSSASLWSHSQIDIRLRKTYIKTNHITLKLVLTHLTKAAFHLLSDRKEVQVKDTTGQQDATIHRGVTNYTDFYFIYLCIELHVKVGMTHRVLLESMKENPHFVFYTTSYSN